jgi:hypothetical protein
MFSVSKLVRRRWTVLVAGLMVALVAFTVDRLRIVSGPTNAVSRPSDDSLENTGYNPKRVFLESQHVVVRGQLSSGGRPSMMRWEIWPS